MWTAARLVLAGLLLLGGCNYGFRGGGGFPPHIRTLYIEPFENRTDRPELDPEVFRALSNELPGSLGVRLGAERVADAIVRGEITRYEDVARTIRPGSQGSFEVEQNQVQVVVAVRIIDVRNNVILWESNSIMGTGDYRPGAQSDEQARRRAVESLIQKIVDGAQSQW